MKNIISVIGKFLFVVFGSLVISSISSVSAFALDSHAVNLSARGSASSGINSLVSGFVVQSTSAWKNAPSDSNGRYLVVNGLKSYVPATKKVLIRGSGPALKAFGVQNTLVHPVLEVFDAHGNMIASNTQWNPNDSALATATQSVGAFQFTPGSYDAALLVNVSPDTTYTASLTSADGTNGVGLLEVFDASASTDQGYLFLSNQSARITGSTGSFTATIGLSVSGGDAFKTFLIRGDGPALKTMGITGTMDDVAIQVFSSATGKMVASNSGGWNSTQASYTLIAAAAVTGAFPLPFNSQDAAVLVTLPPGLYTVTATSSDNVNGIVVLEVYEVPPSQ